MGDSFSFANPYSRSVGLGQEQTSEPVSPGSGFSWAGSAPFAGENVNQMREEMNRMISSPNPGTSWLYSDRGQKDSLQRQMTVGSASDPLEKEADDVSAYVVRDMSDYYLDPRAGRLPSAQREVNAEDEEMQQQSLQRNLVGMDEDAKETLGYTHAVEKTDEEESMGKTTSVYMDRENAASPEGGAVSPDLQRRIENVRNSGGEQIPNGERDFFESRMNRDFSDVRIHTGADAAQVSRDVNAKAFTIGRDVVFGEGQYQPGTPEGRRLMAHELTHTVQQGAAGSLQREIQKKNPTIFTRIILRNGKVIERVQIVRQDRKTVYYYLHGDPTKKTHQISSKDVKRIQYNAYSTGKDTDRNQLNNPVTSGMKGSQQCSPTVISGIAIDLGLADAGMPVFSDSFQYVVANT